MDDYVSALLFAAMPAVANFVGGLLAEVLSVSQRTLSLVLHAAAGIVLAVVGIELMPRALEATQPWIVILAFLLGGAFFLGMDEAIGAVQERVGGTSRGSGPWLIFFGVSIDLFSDGVMIGTGSTIGLTLGLLLALGQTPADIPEGFATIATFKEKGLARSARMLLAAGLALPILLGVTVGYWGVRGQPEIVKLALLAFTGGILVSVVVEEIVPAAHRDGEARLAALSLVGGFALFALISRYLG